MRHPTVEIKALRTTPTPFKTAPTSHEGTRVAMQGVAPVLRSLVAAGCRRVVRVRERSADNERRPLLLPGIVSFLVR